MSIDTQHQPTTSAGNAPRRRSNRRRLPLLVAILAALGLTFSLVTPALVSPGSPGGPTQANAALSDLTIKNIGSPTLFICRSWALPAGVNTSPTCPSTTGYLSNGQTSNGTYGWPDTDGVRVTGGYKLMEKQIRGSGRFAKTLTIQRWGCTSRNIWVKLSPQLGDHNDNLYLVRC